MLRYTTAAVDSTRGYHRVLHLLQLYLFELVIFCARTLRWCYLPDVLTAFAMHLSSTQQHDLLCTLHEVPFSFFVSLASFHRETFVYCVRIHIINFHTRIGINFELLFDSNGWLRLGACLTSWLPYPTSHTPPATSRIPARSFAGPKHPAACFFLVSGFVLGTGEVGRRCAYHMDYPSLFTVLPS